MNLVQQKDDVMFGCMENTEKYFDELDTGQPGEAPDDEDSLDYEKRSLMQDDDMGIMVAFDGMIASSRNKHLPNFISFNTRLNAIAAAPRVGWMLEKAAPRPAEVGGEARQIPPDSARLKQRISPSLRTILNSST